MASDHYEDIVDDVVDDVVHQENLPDELLNEQTFPANLHSVSDNKDVVPDNTSSITHPQDVGVYNSNVENSDELHSVPQSENHQVSLEILQSQEFLQPQQFVVPVNIDGIVESDHQVTVESNSDVQIQEEAIDEIKAPSIEIIEPEQPDNIEQATVSLTENVHDSAENVQEEPIKNSLPSEPPIDTEDQVITENSNEVVDIGQHDLQQEAVVEAAGEEDQEMVDAVEEDHDDEDHEANVTVTSINPNVTFATPSKSLPSLKDIDSITTPKSFAVAKDADIIDTPSLQANSSFSNQLSSMNYITSTDLPSEVTQNQIEMIRGFLSIDESTIRSLNHSIVDNLIQKSSEFSQLQSENSFIKLQTEQMISKNSKIISDLRSKMTTLEDSNNSLQSNNEELVSKTTHQEKRIDELSESNKSLSSKLDNLKNDDEQLSQTFVKYKQDHQQQLYELEDTISKLQAENINQTSQINQLTKDLNDSKNTQFSIKLDLIKQTNSATYFENQKNWYEEELNNSQQRFTELLKKHDSEYLITSNKLSSLTSRHESLENLNKQLNSTNNQLKTRLESEIARFTSEKSEYTIERTKLLDELKGKNEVLELTKRQSQQRADRIQQLEAYSNEIKEKLGNSIKSLEESLAAKSEKVIELEEKLKRVEEVLDEELHKETDLPKLTNSSSLIAAEGISLSSLYSEFTHLKKQLVLERSQKEKLALQLESFVTELESKKPVIASYREQIEFYEKSVQQMIGKVETIRIEKLEAEKDCNRLKSRIVGKENELVSLKKLLRDLGRQLCYYLIHSNIRDNHEDPLSNVEKKAIENILERSGNFDNQEDSDSDRLISERLVEFKSIIELRQKNEELLTAIRQLSRQLEVKEQESNELESVAIEEAKDAILTLQGELDSLSVKYDAITQEKNALTTISSNNGHSSSEIKFLTEVNSDLKAKLSESELVLKKLQDHSKEYSTDLNNKLQKATKTNNELSIQLAQAKSSAQLAETRLQNTQQTLENRQTELESLSKEISFWKGQAEKQEKLIVDKSNELREAESTINHNRITLSSLNSEKQYSSNIINSLKEQIEKLKADKSNLNEFVLNLQSLLKDREAANKELSVNLTSTIENYHSLQEKLQEREDRALVVASQTDLALKAQNTKLEQVSEISKHLLDTRTKLAEKELIVDQLNTKIRELTSSMSKRTVVATGATSDSNAEVSNLNIEIEQLKDDLRISETQVEEMTALAKASETALINTTNSFEEYRSESKANQDALFKEKKLIAEELESITEALHQKELELDKVIASHNEECNQLKSEVQSFQVKADDYDGMKNDYENKLSILSKDLQTQVDLSTSIQQKYQFELQKNTESLEEIGNLKQQVDTLRGDVDKLQNELLQAKSEQEIKLQTLLSEKTTIEDSLQSANFALQELKEQNAVLLNQLELSKPGSEANELGQDLKEVVRYLRREKDAIEAKHFITKEENQNLQARLSQLANELSIAKNEAAFAQTNYVDLNIGSKEHDTLSQQLQQLNILRESNTTLRNESTQRLKRIEALEQQLTEVQTKLDPLTSQINELTTNLDIANQKVSLLEEENELLKSKSTTSGGEESAQLANARERLNAFREQANTRIKSQNTQIATLNESIASLQAEIDKLNKSKVEEIEQVKSETSKQVEELQNTISKTKDEANKIAMKLEKEKSILSEQVSQFNKNAQSINVDEQIKVMKENFEKQKIELRKSLQDEFDNKLKSELESSGNTSSDELRKEIEAGYKKKLDDLEKSVEIRKQQLEKDLNDSFEEKLRTSLEQAKNDASSNDSIEKLRKELTEQHQAEINKLNEDFKKQLDEEKVKTKAQVEKLFEVKMKMLQKKLDRLENKGSTPSAVAPTPLNATTFVPSQTSFGFGSQASKTISPAPTSSPAPSPAPGIIQPASTTLEKPNQLQPKNKPSTVHRQAPQESTLTVRMPDPDGGKRVFNNQNKQNNGNDKKRPFHQNSNSHQAKKQKD